MLKLASKVQGTQNANKKMELSVPSVTADFTRLAQQAGCVYSLLSSCRNLANLSGVVAASEDYFNTPLSQLQISWAIALSPSPLIQKAINGGVRKFESYFLLFQTEKILAGNKILDLGCGAVPAFAHITNSFGAETWTVDRIAASSFYGITELKQATRHVALELNGLNTYAALCERSGGNFDLVTEAHFVGGSECLDGIWRDTCVNKAGLRLLLKPTGLYLPMNGKDPLTREQLLT